MDPTLYFILGGLLLIYFLIAAYNRKQGRQRKSRSFMDGRRLRDRRSDSQNDNA